MHSATSQLDHFWMDIYKRFTTVKNEIECNEKGGFDRFTKSYDRFGLHVTKKGLICFREWLPNAKTVALVGNFNQWNTTSHPCIKNQFGVWTITLSQSDSSLFTHLSEYKIYITTNTNQQAYKLSAWSQCISQPKSHVYYLNKVLLITNSIFLDPKYDYKFLSPNPPRPSSLVIYEAHIGMSSERPEISTYNEFRLKRLPYIKELGYNVIQLMAIMEHSYYASFGYQVTNFFAATNKFGTPNELKQLIDEAHKLGISVFLDIVHSHASSNVEDGINQLDGTNHHFFHDHPKGRHPVWQTRLFDYSKWETQRFLLSNIRFWIEKYRFDGFRFDGVTSMLYEHHGFTSFPWPFEQYFQNVDQTRTLR
eukprot:TRINITY_DN3399_c0_g1_i3.p1 TRINITY_DN3399_c0_g1~~TRINITY_DN3399_c0_g1_i3.p1  ORF type:complete len:365 (+),score=29.26 TRINITY_DN3399_c0_g1_i3:58-1152(+)